MPSRKPRTTETDLPDLILPIEERDHRRGRLGAKYSLVEYGDYESEHCAHLEPVVGELIRELGDDLCYAFRNFPVSDEHPNAQRAAEAAEAADLQAKFWLMHERLFGNQIELSDAIIRDIASDLPLEMDTFARDLASGVPTRRVAEDVESAQEAGVEETPTLFVNGRLSTGSYEFLPLLKELTGER